MDYLKKSAKNSIISTLFVIYHTIFFSNVRVCRFDPTCSQYAKDAMIQKGLTRGTYLALKRLLACHPLSRRPYFDPVS